MQPAPTAAFPRRHPPRAAGNYTLQLSAWNAIGESAPTTASSSVEVAFSTKPRFWSVQGSQAGAELRVIRPDSVAEPDNLRYQVAILRAEDSGSGYFREATPETPSGNGSLADPAVFTIPLSAFGSGVEYAQVCRQRAMLEPQCIAAPCCLAVTKHCQATSTAQHAPQVQWTAAVPLPAVLCRPALW